MDYMQCTCSFDSLFFEVHVVFSVNHVYGFFYHFSCSARNTLTCFLLCTSLVLVCWPSHTCSGNFHLKQLSMTYLSTGQSHTPVCRGTYSSYSVCTCSGSHIKQTPASLSLSYMYMIAFSPLFFVKLICMKHTSVLMAIGRDQYPGVGSRQDSLSLFISDFSNEIHL